MSDIETIEDEEMKRSFQAFTNRAIHNCVSAVVKAQRILNGWEKELTGHLRLMLSN